MLACGAVALVAAFVHVPEAAFASHTDVALLTPGRAVRRTLSAGQTHRYEVAMRTGEFLDVTIEQLNIDTAARVFDAAGTLVREFDSPTGALGRERVRMVADTTAAYRLEVRALQPEADAGAYEIRIASKRAATEADRKMAAAVQAEAEADKLRATAETRGNSVEAFQRARALWQSAADRAGEASTLRGLGFAYVRLKDDAKAQEVFTEAQRIFRELGDRRADAYVYLILANIETRRGNLWAALASTTQSLPLWRSSKDREQEAFTLASLGTIHARLGDASQMKQWHRDAVRVARSTRRPALVAAMFQSEGGAAEILGDRKHALAAYQSALELWREAGNSRGEAAARTRIEELEKPAMSSGLVR